MARRLVNQNHTTGFSPYVHTYKKFPIKNSNEYMLRKFRKKLRQIENLQQINRVLSEEEKIKIASQNEIRKQIQDITAKLEEENFAKEPVSASSDKHLIDFTSGHDSVINPLNSLQTLCSESNLNNNPMEASKISDINWGEAEIDDEHLGSSINWKNETFCISNLTGHHDIIYCVDADESFIITSSRDTTVKVWDSVTGEELHSLRGHKATVTSVLLVPKEVEKLINYHLQIPKNPRLAISGGHDCMVFIWSLSAGLEIHSVYTYNAVTCLGLFEKANLLISGTDGGKLELWNLPSLEEVNSLLTYEESISAIKVDDNFAFISSSEGIISVIELRDKEMHCIFSSEGVLANYNKVLVPRFIHSLEVFKHNIYYGDDGVNVKIIDWKCGIVQKLTNHLNQYGLTDTIKRTNHELICSSYDLDTGESSLNIFTIPANEYVTSLKLGSRERILSLTCTKSSNGKFRIITAGTKLKIWDAGGAEQTNLEMTGKILAKPVYISRYVTTRISSDSSCADSTDDSADDSKENVKQGRFETTYYADDMNRSNKTFLWSWCNIL